MKTHNTPTDTTDDLSEILSDEEVQDFKKKSLSGAIVYTLRTLVLTGISTVTSFILAAYLTEVNFGVYGLVTQIVMFLQFFSDVGLGPTLVQLKHEPSKREYQTVFTIQQLLSWFIFIMTVAIGFVPAVQAKLGGQGVWLLMALGISFPLTSLKIIPSIMLERKLNFSKLVVPHMAEHLIYNVLLVVLVLKGYGLEAYSWAIIARSVVGAATIYILQRWPLGFAVDRASLREILGTGVKFQASDLLARVKDNLTFLLIGWFLPSKEFGYITFSKQFSQMPYNMTVQNVIAITFPAYSRLQKDTQRLAKAIEKTLFFISLTIFPILGGMIVFVKPLTEVISKYQKWQPAIPLFILMTLSIGWGAISTPLTNTLNAIGQINTTLKLMTIWTVLTWILTPVAIWQFGFTGVGVAAFLISFTSVLPIYYVKKTIPIKAWSQVWRQLLSTIVMIAIGYAGMQYWGQNTKWLLTGMIVVGMSYILSFGLVGWRRLRTELESLRK